MVCHMHWMSGSPLLNIRIEHELMLSQERISQGFLSDFLTPVSQLQKSALSVTGNFNCLSHPCWT
jgi:hypothetical protein